MSPLGLSPPDQMTHSHILTATWIYYSQTKAGNIKQLSALAGLSNPEDIDCHFVICNGLGGRDGLIQTTEKWKRQWSIIASHETLDSAQTIRICIIADGTDAKPTDFQVKRAEALTEEICRRFGIELAAIGYPESWWKLAGDILKNSRTVFLTTSHKTAYLAKIPAEVFLWFRLLNWFQIGNMPKY